MTDRKNGGGEAPKPLNIDELLELPPDKLNFWGRLKIGNHHETRVRALLAIYGYGCCGVQPDRHREGVVYAKEQRDILLLDGTPIEVKSCREYFTGPWDFTEKTGWKFVTLDDLQPWKKKDPRPRAVITIAQKATDLELLEGKGFVIAVDEYSASSVCPAWIWGGQKEVVRVPVSTCIGWLEFVAWLEKIGVPCGESFVDEYLAAFTAAAA
jgi:hypothetical protein